MQELTIRQALLHSDKKEIYGGVYVISHADTCFYVGISNNALFRLLQHCGFADSKYSYPKGAEIADMFALGLLAVKYTYPQSHIGRIITFNCPGSLEWAYTLYDMDDCLEAVETYVSTKFAYYQKTLDTLKPGKYNTKLAAIAETAMILKCQPALNANKNPYQRKIPAIYV